MAQPLEELKDKLAKIEALLNGATTPGEAWAALKVKEQLTKKIEQLEHNKKYNPTPPKSTSPKPIPRPSKSISRLYFKTHPISLAGKLVLGYCFTLVAIFISLIAIGTIQSGGWWGFIWFLGLISITIDWFR